MTGNRHLSGLIRVVGLSAVALALALPSSAKAQSKNSILTLPPKASRADGSRQIVVESASPKFKRIAAPKAPRVDPDAAGSGSAELYVEAPKASRPKVAAADVAVEPEREKVAPKAEAKVDDQVEDQVEEEVEDKSGEETQTVKRPHKNYNRHGYGYGRYYDGPPPHRGRHYGASYDGGPRHYGRRRGGYRERSYGGYRGRSYGGYSGCK